MQGIKRGFVGKSWGRRKRKLYSQHKQEDLDKTSLNE